MSRPYLLPRNEKEKYNILIVYGHRGNIKIQVAAIATCHGRSQKVVTLSIQINEL